MTEKSPGLYGLTDTNTNRTGSQLWGKNQFNSAFPVALSLKMRDDGVNPVYVYLDEKLEIRATSSKLTMNDVLGSKDDEVYYCFESGFAPFESFVGSPLEKIDLVVLKDTLPFRPIEVKLTVVPDSATVKDDDANWAPELVVRPVSSAYAMMGIARRLRVAENKLLLQKVEKALRGVYSNINDWTNSVEINQSRVELVWALQEALEVAQNIQQPFLLQPIWKTEGQSLKLRQQCFDVFVWSDAMVMNIPLKTLTKEMSKSGNVKAFYEACALGHFNYTSTYRGMSLGNQTDKAYSISGKVTKSYLKHHRLFEPYYSVDVLSEIILNGGEQMLKPERRLDAALVARRGG